MLVAGVVVGVVEVWWFVGGGALSNITGIFNPALSATLRRVVPGGTVSVPPYLSFTLCKSCDFYILLGNLIKSITMARTVLSESGHTRE